ncbi:MULTISPECIES: hypothetical protein [Chryseobacterium]|uniref:hypothetical protein n=1 Tax=Chryseobacterium TaxID=59732 RepID=UPI000788239F|nr:MULTISPECIES: hypothetical protein [Chryseobacterium]KYH07516.1 hypothetical protein A1704_02245 [Chryseobacterium cucumeris]WFB68217.1 hypothetical protein PZ898_02160 [Chryseobacterium sp. WX]
MKILVLTAGLLLFVSCKNEKDKIILKKSISRDSSTAKKDSVKTNTTEKPIDQIKKEYAVLQAQLETKKLSSSKFNYDCNDEPSGEVFFYSDKDGIKVIEHFYAEHSHFSASEKYFIKDGKPFFIFRQETVWNFDGGTPEKPVTKDDITETRIYLQNNQPLKCLEKKYSIKSDQKEKTAPDTIPGKEIRCNVNEILQSYQSLLKHKDQKGSKQCL